MNKKLIGVIVVIAVLVLISVITLNNTPNKNFEKNIVASGSASSSENLQAQSENVVINLAASRYEYSPATIRVKKGQHVKIIVNNIDTQHGITIPALNLRGMNSVEFDAMNAGTYEFKCPTMCGTGHREMKGTLIIEE